MKLRVTLPCFTCHKANSVNVELMAAWWEWVCPACDKPNQVLTSEEYTLGWRILEKARREYLDNRDYSMAIVLAAMAIEADIARLFFKWRSIDVMRTETRRPTDEELDVEYRALGTNIATKINRVARLLAPAGIDAFAEASPFGKQIADGYPSLTVGSWPKTSRRLCFGPATASFTLDFSDTGQMMRAGSRTSPAWSLPCSRRWTWHVVHSAKLGVSARVDDRGRWGGSHGTPRRPESQAGDSPRTPIPGAQRNGEPFSPTRM